MNEYIEIEIECGDHSFTYKCMLTLIEHIKECPQTGINNITCDVCGKTYRIKGKEILEHLTDIKKRKHHEILPECYDEIGEGEEKRIIFNELKYKNKVIDVLKERKRKFKKKKKERKLDKKDKIVLKKRENRKSKTWAERMEEAGLPLTDE